MVSTCFTPVTGWSAVYFLMTISLFFLLPLIILIVLYATIARHLISSDNKWKIRLSKPELSLKPRKQVVLMLGEYFISFLSFFFFCRVCSTAPPKHFPDQNSLKKPPKASHHKLSKQNQFKTELKILGAVVLSFFVCLMPFRVLTLWIVITSEDSVAQINWEAYYNVLYFSRIMWYLNSAINPILYNLMSSKFRKGFLKLCSCCLLFKPIKTSLKVRERTATFNTTTTSSYLTSTLNSTSDHQHQQILIEQRKLSGKMTLSLDDLRLIEVVVNQEKKRRLTRQHSSPLFSFPLDKKADDPTTMKPKKILHDKIHLYVNNNELVQNLKPKSKYSANRLLFKCNHDNHSHVLNYHKQLSFDDNLLINNNQNYSRNKIKLQSKRYRSVRFASTITTSPQATKVTWQSECGEKILKNKRKSNESSEPNTLVPLLCSHNGRKSEKL